MGSCQGIGIKHFSIGCFFSMKTGTIPRSYANFLKSYSRSIGHIGFAKHRIGLCLRQMAVSLRIQVFIIGT